MGDLAPLAQVNWQVWPTKI